MDKKSIFDISNADVISLFLDSIEYNYCVIDKEGNYIVQNNSMSSHISSGAVKAQEIDLPSWEHCLEVMKLGKKVTKEEEFNGRHYLSIKDPIIQEGKCLGIRTLSFDITDRKKAQIELSKAKDALEKANKAQINLLNMINHESRDPMNVILGSASIILNKKPENFNDIKTCLGACQNHAKNIGDYGRRLMGIINYIYDFVTKEVLDGEIVKDTLTLDSIVATLKRKYGAELEEKSVKLEINTDVNLPKQIIVNSRRLLSIFDTVVSNAVKYTNKGSINIKITGNLIDEEKFNLIVDIRDTGIGIHEGRLKHIFAHFDVNKDQPYLSSGLMLSITKERVNTLGGNISIESKIGKGTHVQFNLPVGYEEKSISKLRQCQNPSVLLVEDDEVISRVMKALLEFLNCRVDVANKGKEAIQLIKKNPEKYDIILLDIVLGDSLGYEVAVELREILEKNGREDVPIIAVTANISEEDQEKCADAGIDDIYHKPVSEDDLLEILDKHLS